MGPRGLIFDLDDTLYPRTRYVQSGLAAASRVAAARYGIPADAAFTAMRAAPAGSEFQTLGERFGLPADIVPVLLSVFRDHTPSLWLFHDAEPALQQARAAGWRMAILTNGLPSVQAKKVEALALRGLVDDVVFAEEYAEGGKPNSACFREAARRLRLPVERCVMVGDDETCDIRGARAAGLRTIRLLRTGAPDGCDADLIVKSLADVTAAASSLVHEVDVHAA